MQGAVEAAHIHAQLKSVGGRHCSTAEAMAAGNGDLNASGGLTGGQARRAGLVVLIKAEQGEAAGAVSYLREGLPGTGPAQSHGALSGCSSGSSSGL